MSNAKKRMKYSQEDVKNALDAIKIGMSVKAASLKFKIPRSTLTAKKYAKYADKKPGPESILSQYEENVLENWILDRCKIAVPVTKEQLLNSVKQIVSDRVTPFKNNKPGRHWYKGFMKRHSQLRERVVENLSVSRAQVTEKAIRAWFSEIDDYLKLNNLYDIEPTRIFNADETALLLNPKISSPAIVEKGKKIVYSSVENNEKESLTALIVGNAAGQLVPPLILFAYRRIPTYIMNKLPQEWGCGISDNGWMTGENFFEYVVNIFYPWLLKTNIKLPIILYIDGHVSHLTQPLSAFCMKHQIILIALYPHSTHILQPLDVSMFRPLKLEYSKVVEKYRIEYDYTSVQKEDFAHLLKKTLNNLDIKTILENGFRTCGLHPFNVNAVNYDKLLSNKRNSLTSEELENDKKYESALRCIEEKVNVEIINLFKKHDSKHWTGKLEDKSLFELWWDLTHPSSKHLIQNDYLRIDLSNKHNENEIQVIEHTNNVGNISSKQIDHVELLIVDECGNLITNDVVNEDFQEKFDEKLENLQDLNETLKKKNSELLIIDECGNLITNDVVNEDFKEKCNEKLENVPQDLNETLKKNSELSIVDECGNLITINLVNEDFKETFDKKLKNLPQELNDGISTIIISSPGKSENTIEPSSTSSVCYPLQDISNLDSISGQSEIPSSFQKYLYWPKEKVFKKKLKKEKEKLPSVVTSSLWLQYQNDKDEKKRKIENEKIERKKIRLAKAEIKKENIECQKKKKMEKKQIETVKKNKIKSKGKKSAK